MAAIAKAQISDDRPNRSPNEPPATPSANSPANPPASNRHAPTLTERTRKIGSSPYKTAASSHRHQQAGGPADGGTAAPARRRWRSPRRRSARWSSSPRPAAAVASGRPISRPATVASFTEASTTVLGSARNAVNAGGDHQRAFIPPDKSISIAESGDLLSSQGLLGVADLGAAALLSITVVWRFTLVNVRAAGSWNCETSGCEIASRLSISAGGDSDA